MVRLFGFQNPFKDLPQQKKRKVNFKKETARIKQEIRLLKAKKQLAKLKTIKQTKSLDPFQTSKKDRDTLTKEIEKILKIGG